MFPGVASDTVKRLTTAEKAHKHRIGLELVDRWMGTFLSARTEPTDQLLFFLRRHEQAISYRMDFHSQSQGLIYKEGSGNKSKHECGAEMRFCFFKKKKQ